MRSRDVLVFWLLLLGFLPCTLRPANAADSISPGKSLTGSQTITSERGSFVLGFFSPGNSLKYYIGIWYGHISAPTVVWVANRETPLPDKSSQLKIAEDGNLVLLTPVGTLVWSTNASIAGATANSTTVAVLRDNGNLVLSQLSNTSDIAWQSFDHPTHTWLPTGWLGLNKATGVNQRLISWRSDEDPAPGPFSLQIDPAGTNNYLLLWNGSRRYWESGKWNDQTKIFDDVPEMNQNFIYRFNMTSNEDRNYFSYTVSDPEQISRFVISVSGQILQQTWLKRYKYWNQFWSMPRAKCDVFSLCGPFGKCDDSGETACKCLQGFHQNSSKEWNLTNWAGGCARKTPLRCEMSSSGTQNQEEDVFLPISNIKLPENPVTSNATAGCESACLSNCACTAYASVDGRCLTWVGALINLRSLSSTDANGRDLYLRLAASEKPSPGKNKGNAGAIAGGAAAAAMATLGITAFIFCRRRRRTIAAMRLADGSASLKPFSYHDLRTITKNFSEKLGAGGFGSVFKAVLPDSTVLAVKKLESMRQGEKQFRMEVCTIGNIQHVNLIRLRGFCSEGNQRLLVYDFMPNGSLEAHLFRKTSALDWKTRYQIALGTARGLAYLHEGCRDCIIHCDIKPENVLLDADFCPKVADFGMAKLLGRDFSRVLTTMRGTRGYLAPEWISGVAITSKADVYSYGMMLLEVISGRRNLGKTEEGEMHFFPTWAVRKVIGGDVLAVLDPELQADGTGVAMDELLRAARVACWCIQDDEEDRPSMGQVAQILEGILEAKLPPFPKRLQIIAGNEEAMNMSSDACSSANPLSDSSTSASSKD